MKPVNSFFLFVFLILLTSCGNDHEKSIKIPDSFDSQALLSASKDLRTLISVEEIASVVNQNAQNISRYYENFHSESSRHTLSFYWPDGTKSSIETLEGKTMVFENQNAIGIAFVRKMSREEFNQNFTTAKGLQKTVEELVNDTTIHPDVAIAEAQYLSENAKIQRFEKIENQQALMFWEMPIAALHVQANEVAFTITTNYGDNEKKSKQQAFLLAEKIINNYSNQ